MIVLDIDEESGPSFYETLGLSNEKLAQSKDPTQEVRNASRKLRKSYQLLANKGDKDAEKRLGEINEAETILKDAAKRKEYDKTLNESSAQAQEILRIRPIAPLPFRDRAARIKLIDELMRKAGLARPILDASRG